MATGWSRRWPRSTPPAMEGPVTGPHGDPTAKRLAQLVGERGQILATLHALADWRETKADKARQFPGPESRAINLEPTEDDQP